MKCAKCGKSLKSNEKFCTNCGYYNDGTEEEIINETIEDDKEDNWLEDEVEANTKEDEEETIVEEAPKKEKKKKEKKEKVKKEEKKEEPVKVEVEPVAPVAVVVPAPIETQVPMEDELEEPQNIMPVGVEVVEEKPKKEKKEKVKKEKIVKEKPIKEKEILKEDKSDEFYYENEKYLEAYIGEDYKIIKKSPFNIWAFLLNWMYFLYRKLFITGIIGLIITTLIAFFFTKYFLIYLIIMLIVLGFGFNPYYIFISKRKVESTLKEYEGSDSFTLENECRKLGGVNIIFSLIIYTIFLVIIILSITGVKFNLNHNTKFWKENSENKANCLSLTKLAYNQEHNNYQKIEEAICKVSKTANKEYTIYLKAIENSKVVYVYYETENNYIIYKNNTNIIKQLEEKQNNNRISDEDLKLLGELRQVSSDYTISYNKSLEEDKLIEKKTNKEEKRNYIISYEELIR